MADGPPLPAGHRAAMRDQDPSPRPPAPDPDLAPRLARPDPAPDPDLAPGLARPDPDPAARPPLPGPGDVDPGPFTVATGLARGLTPSFLRSPVLDRPLRGVRALPFADADPWLVLCRAALLVAPPGAAVSHGSALRLHGVALPQRVAADARVHVTVGPRASVARHAAVATHRADRRPPARVVHGVAVVEPVTAWVQVAGRLRVDDLVVVADGLTRRTDPPATPDALRAAVGALRPGTRGVRRLREALELARPGTDSAMETLARLVLVRAGLPCPVVNTDVYDAWGRFVARPDLHYPDLRIVIEYDGDVHRTDPATWRRDVERRQRLEDDGWVVVTATADDVLRKPERLVARVVQARRRRAAPTPSPR